MPRLPAHLAAFAAFLLVLGGHFLLIDRAGSPVPIHDQWQAEAEYVFLPSLEGTLNAHLLFHYHGEHRIVPTRLLALALFKLNHDRWDVLLQMTFNAVLAALLTAALVLLARRFLRPPALLLFATAFGALHASALFYGNALWGFQSQFYFLLVFTLTHLALVLRHAPFSARWFLGLACSALACLSMGSGFFSAAIVALLSLWRFLAPSYSHLRRPSLLNTLAHLTIVLIALTTAPHFPSPSVNFAHVLHTFLHCLAWPIRFYNPWGALLWLPFAVFLFQLALRFRRAPSHRDLLLAALGLWVLAQIAAIAWARSTPAPVIAPRYYDILLLGLAANTLALARILRVSRLQLPLAAHFSLVAATLLWLGTSGWFAFHFAESHRRYDLPALASYAERQIHHVRTFLATDNPAALQSEPYPKIPHPDPAYLAQLLRNPRVRAFLPAELNDLPPPLLSRVATHLRSFASPLLLAGLVTTFVATTLLIFRPKSLPVPSHPL